MSLLRSLIIGGLAVGIAHSLCALLADGRPHARRLAWVMLLAPYFTPILLTGYGYASFSMSLIHHPALNAWFYSALLLWKFTPVAAVILHFTPAPISSEAVHCWRLGKGRGSRVEGGGNIEHRTSNIEHRTKFEEWRFLVRAGCARGPAAAFAIVFLFAFTEFEMASLMIVKTWTVSLFDAHAGGLALSESFRRMLGPLLCQAVAVTIAVLMLRGQRTVASRRAATSRATDLFARCYLVTAFVFVTFIPASLVLCGMVRGLNLMLKNFVLGREIISSLLFAAGATLLAGLIAFWLYPARRGGRLAFARALVVTVTVCVGLLGPLVLALSVLSAVQLPGLLALRDTPLPLVLTLGLVLLPLAVVLKRVLDLAGYRSATHLPALMQKSRAARELTWRLSTSGKFWAIVVLFICAYWDLTASAILAPIGMTPVTVRLYNLMHYGQIAALSAMTCAAFAAPVVIFVVAWATRRWWAPR